MLEAGKRQKNKKVLINRLQEFMKKKFAATIGSRTVNAYVSKAQTDNNFLRMATISP